ncbi:hypothetical protein N7452_010034 [Penicillium brevicompactum]|uniref:10 kDa heat shock protein, mitochondrial n=1 Tax=Penicillium brevicompactum TaxID=5074 RepID=A0A9W9UBS6_PENBR|nr:hypothetical protein N7452_010034 [Penicillium brevicompactum]
MAEIAETLRNARQRTRPIVYMSCNMLINCLLVYPPQHQVPPPLLDRVLVQRIKPEAKTASGIFLPEAAVKEQNEAQVLAVGPGLFDKEGKRLPMGVAAGDKVLIPQFGGNAIKVGEEEYTLFRDHEYVSTSLLLL